MQPSIKKCQWVASNSTPSPLSLNNENLDRVNSYKYLGVKWRKFKENSKRIQKLSPEATVYTIIDDVLNSLNISLFKELMLVHDNHLKIVSKIQQNEKISKQKQTTVTWLPKDKSRVGMSKGKSVEWESRTGQLVME